MEALINDLRTANERQKRWRYAKRFFKFLGLTADTAALGGPATAIYATAGKALASVGTYVMEETAPMPRVEAGLEAATLVLDARRKLGIE
jgi:hypothetical protein